MTRTLPARALALSAAIATLAAALVSFPATPLAPASSAAADTPACVAPVADYPNVHGQIYGVPWGFYGVDPEVGVYINGNWTIVAGAAEAEGTIVVGGSAAFSSGDYFNLGTVGLGSQVSAGAGTDMLTTGGNISVSSGGTLDVGNHRGGNLVAGGTITPTPPTRYELNGGTYTEGAVAPLTPYASVPAYYQALSTTFAGLPIGTETVDLLTDPSEVRFIGDGVSMRQVFTVSGSDLGTDASQKGVAFSNIPANAVIVVNVTGTSATMSNYGYSMNGSPLDFSAAEPDRVFSTWTQTITWNFPTATSVSLGLNAQLPGSVLIPTASSTLALRTSINGRLYVNGDVTFGGTGTSGLEIHNYPLRNCVLSTGELAITKALSDPADVVADSRLFTGTYTCTPLVGADITGTWSVTAGSTQTVTGLPDGATCTIAEDALALPPTSSDTSYVWGAPTYSAAQTIVAGATVAITATNSFTRQTGSFAIAKALTDPDGVVAAGRLFTGTYTCDPQTGADITGTWSIEAGDTQTVTGIPAGSTCLIVEDTLGVAPSADPSYVWGAPSYSPTSVTTGNGTTVTITATNTVLQDQGSLAITKTLSDPSDVVANSRVFTGTYSCDPPTGADITGTWSIIVGATQTVTGLPTGTVCTILEDTLTTGPSADTSYVWGAPSYSPANGTVTTGGTVTLTAQNSFTRQTGSFAITKTLTDPTSVVASGRVFTGTYTCEPQSGADITGTWSVQAGATQTVTGVPLGSSCSIAEDALTTAPSSTDPSYVWSAPTYSPSSVTTTGGTVSITATNTVTREVGSIAVDKVLSDPDSVVGSSRAFTGTISCTVGTPSPNTWSVTAAGAPVVFSGIPAGSVCTIAEDALTVPPSSTDSSYVWRPSTFLTPNVITVGAGATATVQVFNEVRRALGNLELIKVLDDPFGVVLLTRVYTGTFECLDNAGADITPAPGTWSTTAGAPAISLATNLPAGTVCTVAEDPLTDPPLIGFPQYQWRAASYSPTTITITDGVTGRFTVTNTVFDPFAILPHMGTDAAAPLLIGGGSILAGLLAVLFGYRRRRRSA